MMMQDFIPITRNTCTIVQHISRWLQHPHLNDQRSTPTLSQVVVCIEVTKSYTPKMAQEMAQDLTLRDRPFLNGLMQDDAGCDAGSYTYH